MKKILILIFCLFLVGCSKPSEGLPTMEWGEDDLSVTEVSSQSVISYGMTKAELEKIAGVGEGTSEEAATRGDTIYLNGLYAGYRDDVVAELIIEGEGYQTLKGISIGSTLQDVEQFCGHTDFSRKSVVVGSTARLIQYLFNQEGALISEDAIPDKITSSQDFYVVSFELDSNKVIRIRICDAQFSYNRT